MPQAVEQWKIVCITTTRTQYGHIEKYGKKIIVYILMLTVLLKSCTERILVVNDSLLYTFPSSKFASIKFSAIILLADLPGLMGQPRGVLLGILGGVCHPVLQILACVAGGIVWVRDWSFGGGAVFQKKGVGTRRLSNLTRLCYNGSAAKSH